VASSGLDDAKGGPNSLPLQLPESLSSIAYLKSVLSGKGNLEVVGILLVASMECKGEHFPHISKIKYEGTAYTLNSIAN